MYIKFKNKTDFIHILKIIKKKYNYNYRQTNFVRLNQPIFSIYM
jgi:hypothetical protein